MANIKEIQDRMRSIQDTLKITNAMYMISTSKLKKSKKMLADTEPYFFALQSEMSRILRHLPEFEDIYFESDSAVEKKPEEKRVGYIVITADKGLAGSYNHNIMKAAYEHLQTHPNNKLFVLGELGRHYFAKRDVEIDTNFKYTVQRPTMHRARDISGVILEQFRNRELDEVYVVYTRMENSVQAEAEVMKLLPLERSDFGEMKMPLNMYREEIELNPSPMAVMNSIVPSYINGMIYGCLVEAYASEHNARMMAMKSATDSAQELIKELSILYNRARQAAITQEITEVCSGARAQQKKS